MVSYLRNGAVILFIGCGRSRKKKVCFGSGIIDWLWFRTIYEMVWIFHLFIGDFEETSVEIVLWCRGECLMVARGTNARGL